MKTIARNVEMRVVEMSLDGYGYAEYAGKTLERTPELKGVTVVIRVKPSQVTKFCPLTPIIVDVRYEGITSNVRLKLGRAR